MLSEFDKFVKVKCSCGRCKNNKNQEEVLVHIFGSTCNLKYIEIDNDGKCKNYENVNADTKTT